MLSTNARSARIAVFAVSDPASKPRIALAADHAGYHAKEIIKKFLQDQGYVVDDVGTHSEDSVDYPDFGRVAAERVAAGGDDLGILVCGTGIGMDMTANKVPGIRAATAHDAFTARMAREHNDANVLTLGARVVDDARAIEIVREFLGVTFAGGRHQRRVDKINALDQARAPK
jgi:ribose 5-phosphate isomerase B